MFHSQTESDSRIDTSSPGLCGWIVTHSVLAGLGACAALCTFQQDAATRILTTSYTTHRVLEPNHPSTRAKRGGYLLVLMRESISICEQNI